MRNFTLLLALSLTLTVNAAKYSTTPTGKIYTFADLAAIPESGVTVEGNVYSVANDIDIAKTSDGTIADGFKFENNIVVKLADKVAIRVYGPCEFVVTDTATVCPLNDTAEPKGFHFYKMSDTNRTISHVRFEGACLNVGNPDGTVVENCTFFKNNTKLGNYALQFSAKSINNVVRNCHFEGCLGAGIGSGANVVTSVTVENNVLTNCSTQDRNLPYINMGPSGSEGLTTIRNNKVLGAKGLKAGGIYLIDSSGTSGASKFVVENNEVSDCRYGISLLGCIDGRVLNNKIFNCHYESNSDNGGSGITVNSSKTNKRANAYVEGNYIEGCLWGVTVLGTAILNMGCLSNDIEGVEYNPGKNVLKNNGNCGMAPEGETTAFDPSKPYDLYNNTDTVVYAQGNIWGGTDQSAAEIEKRIFHKVDDATLGEVIFMPAGDDGGVVVTEKEVFQINVNADHTFSVSGVDEDTPVVVYDFSGIALWRGKASQTVVPGRRGLLIVAVGNVSRRIVL